MALENALQDLFSLDDPQSFVRQKFTGYINLKEHDFPLFELDETYSTRVFQIGKNQDTLDYRNDLSAICRGGRHTGKHEKFCSAVVEAFRNAYQHGNHKDSDKKIVVSSKATKDSFEVVVSDEGGLIKTDLAPFVLLHRQGLNEPYSFYRFAPGTVQKSENGGIGTFVIHAVSDEVRYFKNTFGGLSVQLIIHKKPFSLDTKVQNRTHYLSGNGDQETVITEVIPAADVQNVLQKVKKNIKVK